MKNKLLTFLGLFSLPLAAVTAPNIGTPVTYYATGVAAGSTGTETAIPLARSAGLNAVVTPLANVGTPTVTTVGTTGAATWGYKIVATDANGTVTAASTQGTTATGNGNATLTTNNLQRVTWTTVPGAVSYSIYRTASGGTPASTGLIGTCTCASAGTFDDTGIAGDASSPPTVNTTGTSFIVGTSSGRRFIIMSIEFGCHGNATGTAQNSVFSVRINKTGIVTTTSTPVILKGSVATVATSSAWDKLNITVPMNDVSIDGDGTIQFGVTANATYTTNAPTWDVLITGIESNF